jgi:hypothetical protein
MPNALLVVERGAWRRARDSIVRYRATRTPCVRVVAASSYSIVSFRLAPVGLIRT